MYRLTKMNMIKYKNIKGKVDIVSIEKKFPETNLKSKKNFKRRIYT